MQFSKNWLKEFVDIKVSTEELCEQLTMLGIEVSDYKNFQSKLTGNDAVIKLDITPNRGDCFSILGVARELSALYGSKLYYPKPKAVKETVESPINVKICEESPAYVGRYITQLDLKKRTPLLIKERLKLSEMRSIDPIVDITNYVLLELGQPLHIFDRDQLQGNLRVRFAKNNEKIILLDEKSIKFSKDCLVIADDQSAVAFAGIMGGLKTGVTAKTKSIYLESAFFKPEAIRGKPRRYGIQTDASMRFERGVDFSLQSLAVKRASALIQEIVGGDFGPVQQFVNKAALPKTKIISFNPSRINKILGSKLTKASMSKILNRLGIEILSSQKRNVLKGKIPSWRFDLDIEADLVEEVARLVGYDKLPENSMKPEIRNKSDLLNQSIRSNFQSLGYNEVITYSFVSQDEAEFTNKKKELILIENPISQNMSVMRPSLLQGLLNTFSYNYNRGIEDLKIFEIGSVFRKKNKYLIIEEVLVGGLISGHAKALNWFESRAKFDFYDLKGDLETISSGLSFRQATFPFLHPGKAATIFKGKKQLGYIGSLDPKLMDKIDIKQDVHFFELTLKGFKFLDQNKFKDFSRFPLAQRDLSFVVKNDVPAKEVMDLIIQKSGKELKDIDIFDVYEGKGIPEGKKSLAFSLFWQAANRTMTDSEIDDIVEEIVSLLSNKLDAKLRTE